MGAYGRVAASCTGGVIYMGGWQLVVWETVLRFVYTADDAVICLGALSVTCGSVLQEGVDGSRRTPGQFRRASRISNGWSVRGI